MSETAAFELIIEDDAGRRTTVAVDLGEVSIGRLESSGVRLDQRNVSRRHARLVRQSGSVYAEDLESYNGVWVNGGRVRGRHEVRDGDLIRIGDFHLRLRGEGLRGREETTRRTMPPAADVTQPRIHVELGDDTPRLMPPDAAPGPEGAAGADSTAIIRALGVEQDERRGEPAPVAGPRAKLVCVSTELAGREFEIDRTEMVIGRTPGNDVVLDHRSVSRHHARLSESDGRFALEDLASANGMLVNGEPYARVELRPGDLVELGHVRLRFVAPGATWTLAPEELAAVRAAAEGLGRVKRRGRGWLLAGGGVALLAVTAALVVAGPWGHRAVPPGELPPVTPDAQVEGGPADARVEDGPADARVEAGPATFRAADSTGESAGSAAAAEPTAAGVEPVVAPTPASGEAAARAVGSAAPDPSTSVTSGSPFPRRRPGRRTDERAVPARPAVGAPEAASAPGADGAEAAYAEAVGLLRDGDLERAIAVLDGCVRADPRMARCYRALGIAHARAGHAVRAAKYYRRYLEVDPGAPDAGKVRQLLGDYESAP